MKMKKLTGKHLAIGTWLIAAISLYLYAKFIIGRAQDGDLYFNISYVINIILIVVPQCILGLAMYREKNDRFTVFVVLLYCFVNILLPVVRNLRYLSYVDKFIVFTLIPDCVLIFGLFFRRKSDNGSKITKIWFVPAAVQLVCSIIIGDGFGIGTVVDVANSLILGYWLWNFLNVRNKFIRF